LQSVPTRSDADIVHAERLYLAHKAATMALFRRTRMLGQPQKRRLPSALAWTITSSQPLGTAASLPQYSSYQYILGRQPCGNRISTAALRTVGNNSQLAHKQYIQHVLWILLEQKCTSRSILVQTSSPCRCAYWSPKRSSLLLSTTDPKQRRKRQAM
jgi:hypothetical protein